MRIEYQGQTHEFDFSDITVKQAIKIEKFLGCPISEFGDRLNISDGKSPDLLALQCLGWLILHAGQGAPIEDTDFSVAGLVSAIAAASPEETAEETPPVVPTVAAMNLGVNGVMAADGQLTGR